MDAAGLGAEVFRYLDVRSPKVENSYDHPYVVDRSRLDFPETSFEKKIKGIKGAGYVAALQAAAQAQIAAVPLSPSSITGGYIDNVREYDACLADDRLSLEAMLSKFRELYNNLKGATAENAYLIAPAANVWDCYVAATILRLSNAQVPDEVVSLAATCLRVAAALFLCKAKPADGEIDLSPFAISGIAIPKELLDASTIRAGRAPTPRPAPDTTARSAQDALVLRLLTVNLAQRELQAALTDRSIKVQAPPATPKPGGGSDKLTAAEPTASIPITKLSATTQNLLINEFGAAASGGNVSGIKLVDVISQLDYHSSRVGRDLFSSASETSVRRFEEKATLLLRELSSTGAVAGSRLATISLMIAPHDAAASLTPDFINNANVRPLGVGDVKVVKQHLLRYDRGEVCNIENILDGQQKERTHSVKQTTEETIVTDQERSTSTEKDLQTTDRFELSDQVNSTVSEKTQNEAGVSVTASYGAVSVSANTKFSDSSSQEQSSKVSRNFARDVVNRSVEKVEQRVREERIKKTTLEIVENNRYSLTASGKNIVGIYRWVDKIYWAQVNVYGKRLMLEFMVPEPAAVYLHSLASKPVDKGAVKEPAPLTISPDQIQRYNYSTLAALYQAELETPPPSIQIARFIARSNADTAATVLNLPEGYVGTMAGPSASWIGPAGASLTVHIGIELWDTADRNWTFRPITSDAGGAIPLQVTNFQATSYNASGAVIAVPSDAAFQQWQLATYKALVDAYRMRQTEYQEYVASHRQIDSSPQVSQDQVSRGIERRELQRACIEILSLQHFDQFGSVVDNASTGWPEIDFSAAKSQGDFAAFFQQSFEWTEMTYVFYPYFWARQRQWPSLLALNAGDQLFTNFLQAGFARVLVPVRAAHESDVLYYLQTGLIWSGSEPPVLGDETYLSVVDEIKESLDAPDGGVPEGDPWQFKIPTSLVILEASDQLPKFPADVPPPKSFIPSSETCNGIPYNLAQWKDAKAIADAIRGLGFPIDSAGDQNLAIKKARPIIRAMQMQFNASGVQSLLGRPLQVDGIVGPCTLRALTYFDALKAAGKWPV